MTFAQPFADYEILDRVGAGAMGTVFKARHKKLGRIVALKVLKPSLARDSRYVDRLRREARIVASLNHPHIVTGYDLGEEGGYHFFVMEFVEGKSLRGLLAEWGVFAEEFVLDIAVQITQALDHAHKCKVIHRDIKPGNVLIDDKGKVKLTDMGLAKGPTDLTLTRDGATVGTPQYISPEQARNPQDVDVRSDLYSLGATLYHMATGLPPFTGDTMAELITKVLHEAPVAPNELNPALSEGFSLVVRKLLAKDLRVRYQTPRELLDDFELLEQALPPKVDPERLATGESERRLAFPTRFVVTVAMLAALGGAFWIGTQLRSDVAVVTASDPYWIDLEATLAGIPTPGERWLHLRALTTHAPAGRELELLRRENVEFVQLQAALDRTAASFTGNGWVELTAWLRSPREWPDRLRFEQMRLMPKVLDATGILPSQLPSMLNTARLAELRRSVDAVLADRDADLLNGLDVFLETRLASLADERLRASDYAGAEKLWREALANFCDGLNRPVDELLAESTVRQARDRCDQKERMAWPQIDAAESTVADAMRIEVATVVRYFDDRLATVLDANEIAKGIARFRQELLQVWPASPRFRAERDPWPEIERMIGEVQQRTALVVAAKAAERFEHRCDLAWRAICHGEAADALAILDDIVPPVEGLRIQLGEHRRAMRAAAAVQDRLLAVLARANRAVLAFPRTGNGLAVELRAETESGQPTLFSQAIGETARRAVLTEFRFSELMTKIRKLDNDPFKGMAKDEVARGRVVFRLIGDDFAGIRGLLSEFDDAFLIDAVAPRIRRVRAERNETVLDRAGLLARMQQALIRARSSGQLIELESAILSFESSVANENDRTENEIRELKRAKVWRALARRRDEVYDDIALGAPSGVAIQVDIDEERSKITAEMTATAAQLMRGAAEGWQLQNGMLEFAGGDRPWSELHLQRLGCETGLPIGGARHNRTVLQLDFVLPSVDSRFYIVEFRGIAVLMALSRDNAVHMVLVDGDPRREEHAERAFLRAMSGVLERPKAVAVPGAVHRLTIDITASAGRQRAAVRVAFEGRELIATQHELDGQHPASIVIYPRQEMAIKQVVVRGSGL